MSKEKLLSTAESYNLFYAAQDGEKSEYERRYERPLEKDIHTIVKNIMHSADKILQEAKFSKKLRPIRVFDYGCGDGRFRIAAQQAAEFLQSKNVKLPIEYIGCDISSEGLKRFKEKLQVEGYKESKFKQGYFVKGFLAFTFCLTTEETPYEEIKQYVGKVDTSFSPFGPISYIKKRKDRIAALQMLGDITEDAVYVSLPGQNHMRDEQEKAQKIRKNKESGWEEIPDEGDIIYERAGGKIKLFFHIYQSMKEMQEDLAAAKLYGDAQPSYIDWENTLLKSNRLEQTDSAVLKYIAKRAPKIALDILARYYEANTYRTPHKHKAPLHPKSLEAQYMKDISEEVLIQSSL